MASKSNFFVFSFIAHTFLFCSELRQSFGQLWLHRDHISLLPTLQSAIDQAGFVHALSGLVWLKPMSDGSQRALAIVLYDDNSRNFNKVSTIRSKRVHHHWWIDFNRS